MRATAFHSGAHLEEKYLLPFDPACPLCFFRGARLPALRLQSDPDVFLLECLRCKGFSASRMPTEEALRAYYGKYYKQSVFREEDEKVTFQEPQRFARHLLRAAGPLLGKQDLTILDFGGGDGNLALAIARFLVADGVSNVRIILVDYNSSLAKGSSKNISLECHESLDSAGAKDCDLVLASGILEHIPYPQKDFARLLSALRPGGLFYARTPCVAPLFRILQRLRLPGDFTFPAHVHDMGEAYWSGILRFLPMEFQCYSVIWSQPSIVETTLRRNTLRTLAAVVMKAPWHVLGNRYTWVGGWEVLIQRLAG
jgi:SAM-dependent methyltransferase